MQASISKIEYKKENLEAILNGNYEKEKPGQIIVPIGKTSDGYVYENYANIPNILISGTTGSGKTAFTQTIILEMMKKYTPNEVKFIIYDSKKVDYRLFSSNQYLLLPVLHDQTEALHAIGSALAESHDRLGFYNEIEKKPHIFIVLDDFSELSSNGSAVFERLVQLFQTSRQTRIHCWIITSTPTSSVIPTELKANVSTRIAFHTASKSVSRSVIDDNGAETLFMPGEMIFKLNSESVRCNAVYLDDEEMVALWREQTDLYPEEFTYGQEISRKIKEITGDLEKPIISYEGHKGRDELFVEAGRCVIEKTRHLLVCCKGHLELDLIVRLEL